MRFRLNKKAILCSKLNKKIAFAKLIVQVYDALIEKAAKNNVNETLYTMLLKFRQQALTHVDMAQATLQILQGDNSIISLSKIDISFKKALKIINVIAWQDTSFIHAMNALFGAELMDAKGWEN